MTQTIDGKDIVVKVDDTLLLHSTSHNLNIDLDLKEVRTKDTDGIEKVPGDISWSVDGENMVVVAAVGETKHTTDDVIGLVLAKSEVDVTVVANVVGGLKSYTGKGYVTSFKLATQVGENATYSYTITGSGSLSADV